MNKTHSHDTATPALSVESEYVLVPREPTPEMVRAGEKAYFAIPADRDGPAMEDVIYRAMIAAAPAPNPSPAAKGGEGGRIMYVCAGCEESNPENCGHTDRRDLGVAPDGRWLCDDCWSEAGLPETATCPPKFVALATPSPQPAEAVREAAENLAEQADHCLMGYSVRKVGIDEAMRELRVRCNALRAALTDPAPVGEAVEPIEKHRIANRLRGMFDMAVASEDDFNRLSPAGFRLLRQAHDALISPEDTARLREDLEEANSRADANADSGFLWKERAEEAWRERDDTRKALETVRAALKAWDDCPDHAFPSTVMEKAAGLAEAVRAAFAARSASREGASDE